MGDNSYYSLKENGII
ncbi:MULTISPECIES: hypothetical protein [Clostridium]